MVMGMGKRGAAAAVVVGAVPPLLAPPPSHHHLNPLLELDERDVVWPHTSTPSSPSPPLPSPRHHEKSSLGLGLGLALSPDNPHALIPRRPIAVPPLLRPDEANRPIQMSAPVNVPVWPSRHRRRRRRAMWDLDEEEEEEQEEVAAAAEENDEDDDGKMVPPHILASRSRSMSFSVFEGVGRTLKGRDLRQVRNAVLQKTGFLD